MVSSFVLSVSRFKGMNCPNHINRSFAPFQNPRRTAPATGAGPVTGSATFNNSAGPIVADPLSHNLYVIFASGETGFLKAKTTDFNKIFVSRSTDNGDHWTPVLVFTGPPLSTNANLFPSIAVDDATGNVYAVWTNATATGISAYFSYSADAGASWSPAVVVNSAPANTPVFAWVAVYGGTADVVYYGTSGANEASAVWNVYFAQTTDNGASFTQRLVDAKPNHVGVICTQGTACAHGTRNLLDFFEVGIDPLNGLAAIVFAADYRQAPRPPEPTGHAGLCPTANASGRRRRGSKHRHRSPQREEEARLKGPKRAVADPRGLQGYLIMHEFWLRAGLAGQKARSSKAYERAKPDELASPKSEPSCMDASEEGPHWWQRSAGSGGMPAAAPFGPGYFP